MDKETAIKVLKELHDKSLFAERTALETLIPELAESEDEKVRKEIISFLKSPFVNDNICDWKVAPWIAWLEKQESVGEIVERCKTSWYNEGKIQGQIEGLSDEEKYQQGWHDALEKQGEQKPAWNEKDEKEYKYVLKFVDNILNNCGNKKDYDHCKRCYDWLKSLKQKIGG